MILESREEEIKALHELYMRRTDCGNLRYQSRPLQNLSRRDVIWLQQLSHGMVIKELKGVTSEQAAKNRILRIRKFLGAYNTTQAVAVAIRQGIIK